MRGTGFVYLLSVCAFLAVPASLRIKEVLEQFEQLSIVELVSRLPAAHLDSSGSLVANDPDQAYTLLRTSEGVPAMLFNTAGSRPEADAQAVPIEFGRDALLIHTERGTQSFPYTTFLPAGSSFEPLETARVIAAVLESTVFTIWGVMATWFCAVLMFNAMLAGAIVRLVLSYGCKTRIMYSTAVRLCAFASTAVAVLLTLQFFIYVPVSYTLMLLVPLVYMLVFCLVIRSQVMRMGLQAFCAQFGLKVVEEGAPQDQQGMARSEYIDALTGRGRRPAAGAADADTAEKPQSDECNGRNDKNDRPGSGGVFTP